ncbi:hypothetical protein N9D22_05295 [Flavobacteriaceae bacterium]|nr:hypothetical protein [Flavobacteriaceae bacterium]
MAKKAQRNYGADLSLVRGEATMRQAGGFQPLAKAFDAPMQRLQQAAKERQAREQQRNNKVESYLSALNSNIDVTALTETDQKTVNQYLMGVKDEYAEAASAIVNFKPGTPEYMEQLDIMNGVKNGLSNLKGQLDGYQESKGNYLDSFKDQSAGNDSLQADNASNIFTGETPFTIGTGGHLFFQGQDGTNMAYKDIKMPFKKDYKTAMQYNDLFTPIYNSGAYDSTKQKVFEDKIRAMMSSNPDGMKSIIADELSSFGEYQDLMPLLDDPAKLEEVTEAFVQRSSEAARNAAAEGKQAKINDQKASLRTQDYASYARRIREESRFPIPMKGRDNQFLLRNPKTGTYTIVDKNNLSLDLTAEPLSKEEALVMSGYSNY